MENQSPGRHDRGSKEARAVGLVGYSLMAAVLLLAVLALLLYLSA